MNQEWPKYVIQTASSKDTGKILWQKLLVCPTVAELNLAYSTVYGWDSKEVQLSFHIVDPAIPFTVL